MKKGFVRILFGEFSDKWIPENHGNVSNKHRHVISRTKTQKEIEWVVSPKNNKPKIDFVTYVFGKENQKILDNLGLKTVLVHDEPYMWWPEHRRIWWHKLHVYRFIAQENNYDEFVYIDWDCCLQKPLFDDFWERLGKKESFQANLMSYRQTILKDDINRINKTTNIVPNGGFVYIRDKGIPDKIWSFADVGANRWLDEAAYARYLDDLMGGWCGVEKYWKLFEPEVCALSFKGPFRSTVKDNCFRHSP